MIGHTYFRSWHDVHNSDFRAMVCRCDVYSTSQLVPRLTSIHFPLFHNISSGRDYGTYIDADREVGFDYPLYNNISNAWGNHHSALRSDLGVKQHITPQWLNSLTHVGKMFLKTLHIRAEDAKWYKFSVPIPGRALSGSRHLSLTNQLDGAIRLVHLFPQCELLKIFIEATMPPPVRCDVCCTPDCRRPEHFDGSPPPRPKRQRVWTTRWSELPLQE